jgi:Peptidase A4 family
VAASSSFALRLTGRRPKARLSVSPSNMTYLGGRVLLRWSSSNAKRCTMASSRPFWRGPNPARVRCRGSFGGTLGAVAATFGWKFTFTARNATGKTVARRTFAIHGPPFAVDPVWAGYVITPGTAVTEVSGEFTVPRLNCLDTFNAGEAMWAGIGGAHGTAGDLLQTGVTSGCSEGTQTDNAAWWEEYPEVPGINFNGMSVSAGDQMRASVYRLADGTTWETCLEDLTTGLSGLMVTGEGWGVTTGGCSGTFTEQGSTATLSYAGGTSAEWIIEDFDIDENGTLVQVPFADFGTVAFSNLTTSLSSWNLTSSDAWGVGDKHGDLLAAPSTPSGNGFSVTYTG